MYNVQYVWYAAIRYKAKHIDSNQLSRYFSCAHFILLLLPHSCPCSDDNFTI